MSVLQAWDNGAFDKAPSHRVNGRGHGTEGWTSMQEQTTAGLCQCGCGERTEIAWRSSTHNGWTRGQPKAYVRGHANRKRREVTFNSDGTARIALARRDGSTAAYALVDAEDAGLCAFAWYLGSRGYAMRQYRDHDCDGRNVAEFLHRRVVGLTRGDRSREVDHINRDKLDNRRVNLRVVTHSENEQNKTAVQSTSGYRNVTYQNGRGWLARVCVDGRAHTKGYFDTPEEAATYVPELRRRWHPFAPSGI